MQALKNLQIRLKLRLMKFYKFIITVTVAVIMLATTSYYYIGGYKKHYTEAESCASDYGVSLPLILAVIKTESNFNPRAVSSKGAIGLMQIMPSTCNFVCESYGIKREDLFNPKFNVLVGTLYLKYLLEKFKSERLAILAYNAGEGRVLTWIEKGEVKNIPFKETKNYYFKIVLRKRGYKAII